MKIIVSILAAFFIIGCSEDTSSTNVVETVTQEQTLMEKASNAATEMQTEVTSSVSEAKETVIEKAAEVKEEVTATTTQAMASASAMVSDIDGKALYAKCAGCHGMNGEKAALGKSAMINSWTTQEIEDALNGYKDGSYGGAMKGMMKGQVAGLSAEEITAIAKHISK